MTLMTWAAVRRRRAPIAWWTIDGGDVQAELPPVTTAVDQTRRNGGGIVLLHDGDRAQDRNEFVLKSTGLLLDAAREHGWSVRTFGELTADVKAHA